MNLLQTIMADLRAPLERDPAAESYLDVVISYPGFQAVTAHRFINLLFTAGVPVLPRFLAYLVRFVTGIDIHPGATLGPGLFIDHGMGVVIGETAEVGANVTLLQGVTLGGTSTQRVKRHPTIGDNVLVGADALVIGAITVGANAKVGAGSVVVKDVPPGATVVGIPARVVLLDGKPVAPPADARPRVDMPDPLAAQLTLLGERVSDLERRLAALSSGTHAPADHDAIAPSAPTFDDATPAI